MRARARVVLALLALAAAGCASPAEDAAPADVTVAPEARPEPVFGEVQAGPAAPPDANATLLAPPRLVPGEWWRIRFESPYTEPTEFLRVVARVEPDGTALVGMPHEGWWKEAVVFHTPALGEIAPDLSYAAHDVPFTPLVFPLAADTAWETAWEDASRTLAATVTIVDETTADVVFTGAACGFPSFLVGCDETAQVDVIKLRYDARQHDIVRFEGPGMTWEVLEHGYGFEGWVTIPRAEDLVFLHGRFGPALDVNGGPNPTLADGVEVSGGYNRVSFVLGAGSVSPGPGVFKEKATAPDGTVYEIETLPGSSYKALFLEHASPDGTWTFEHTAGGPGLVMAEGVAYHQYDIRLPDGAMRTDHAHDVVR